MHQSGNSIHNANLQEFLDSAANAADLGQRQFFTPPNLAAVLTLPLAETHRELLADLHVGSGRLLRAAGATRGLGLDIDARVTRSLEVPDTAEWWKVLQADLTHWYPLACEADLSLPYIAINPPFSLKWHANRLAALRDSSIDAVAATAAAHPQTIDSTLASFLIALDRLHAWGEGFMVCNAATARRLIGDPEAPDPPALLRHVFLWLEIPNVAYENINTAFDTAVLYFSRSHGTHPDAAPRHVRAAAATPDAVRAALATRDNLQANRGRGFRYSYEMRPNGVLEKWNAVAGEYAARHRGRTPEWNIRLDERGRIRTYLTPFQETSVKLDRRLIQRLHSLDKQTPMGLCVTSTSRTALREAAQCGVWHIHPDVRLAIDRAVNEYEAEGAPFYRPNATQSLGWVDEHAALECSAPGIGSCRPGRPYPIQTALENTTWKTEKINLAGDRESVEYTGKELVVTLADEDEVSHHFHVRRDDAAIAPDTDREGRVTARHWHIADLIAHFVIPEVKDITDLRPEAYRSNLAALDRIEARVAARCA